MDRVLDALMATEWVVYAKPCLGHTDTVLAYLARYTHRIALSDRRIVALDGERVGLRCRDHHAGGAPRTVWLDGVELVRRYLLHVLPKGFMRIRHYGLLANRCRAERLAMARAAIAAALAVPIAARAGSTVPACAGHEGLCPQCRKASLRTVRRWPAGRCDTG